MEKLPSQKRPSAVEAGEVLAPAVVEREQGAAAIAQDNSAVLQMEQGHSEALASQALENANTYQNLLGNVTARLKDPTITVEVRAELIKQKRDYQGKIKELQANNPEPAPSNRLNEQDQIKAQQLLIDRIPEESRKKFNTLIQNIPEHLRQGYIRTLEGCLKNKDEVTARTQVRGLVFELSRINNVIQQGLEQVDFNLEIPQEIEFLGFAKDDTDFSHEPTRKYKSPIQLDVPITRDGNPHVYEAKSYPRMQYGSQASHRNQLLKYQSSIEQGVVEGATVEIKGRIDPDFLKWATGTNIAEAGRIPDVEIIYTFDLPSGAEHRFVLKRSRKHNGLHFENEGRSSTPEATLKTIKEEKPDQFDEMVRTFGSEEEVLNKLVEDRRIINGLQRSVLDRSIIDVLATVDIENPPQELQPYLADPMTIKSTDLFDQYEALRKESIYKKLLGKREIINVDNKRSAYSEFATREYVETSLREYQSYLSQNPEMAKVKKAYILNSEDDIQTVIGKVMSSIEKVRDFELQRIEAEQSSDNHTREDRAKMGYSGQPEGVALDIEHLTIDAIQETNKKKGQTGRSYENPERFKDVESLKEYLPNQDRRYLEIAIYDPISGKTERNIDVNEIHIKRTVAELLKENIRRAEERLQQITARVTELNQKPDKTVEESNEIRVLSARSRAKEMQGRNIENIKQQVETLKSEKIERVKAERDNTKKKGLAAEYDDRIAENMGALAALYTEVLGGEKEWDKVAKRISEKIDQNIIKFIYAVKSTGEIVVGEEIIRGDASGRAAHSELAQGRNVYGAGELAFTKDKNGEWALTEINNGSGHYRPSVLTLPYVKNLLTSRGIDTNRVELRDTLLRGTPPPDLTMLEE